MLAVRGHRPRWGAAIVAALVALLGASVITAPAGAAIDSSSGVSAVAFAGDLDVFYTGRDAGLWQLSFAPSAGWDIAQEIPGGVLTSAPAVDVFRSGTEVDVFARGTDNALWQRYYRAGAGWSGWFSLGGGLTSAPAVDVFRSGTEVDVFVRGTDNAVWQRYYRASTGWSAWGSLGGVATSAPSADVFRNGAEVDVFVRGTDNGLWQRSYTDSTGWSGWVEIPGTNGELASAPSAVVSPDGTEVHVFYAGANGALFDTWYSAVTGAWSAPAQIPGTVGTVGTAPAAVTFAGSIDVFYLSSSTGVLQVSSPDGRTWQGPVTPGPPPPASPPSPPPATTTPPPSTSVATQTITPPVKRHGSRPRVRAMVMITWRWTPRGTWIKHVKTSHFPRRGRLTVGCSGSGCPLDVSAGKHQLGRLWRSLEHHRYSRGNIVTIEITEPGHAAERGQFRIRHEQIPVLRQS